MTKAELRRLYLEKQKSISDVERNEKSAKIADRFFESFDLAKINFLHGFLPIENKREIDTRLFFERLWKHFPQITTAVSRVDFATLTLATKRLTSCTKLVENKWGIPEPEEGEIVETTSLDAVLVPLLCCAESGFRVGYGKGFYDRFLIKCRPNCLKIGLSYFAPVSEISDVQNFDVRLDFCVTPIKIYQFAR